MSKNVEHATHRALIDCGVKLAKEFGMYGYTVEQLPFACNHRVFAIKEILGSYDE